MAKTRTVGIRELKNNLSAYLRDVREGGTITVSDRGRPVAVLRSRSERAGEYAADLADEWARGGTLDLPTARKRPLEAPPVRLRSGASQRLLEADRAEA